MATLPRHRRRTRRAARWAALLGAELGLGRAHPAAVAADGAGSSTPWATVALSTEPSWPSECERLAGIAYDGRRCDGW
jgi:hypothetical protein